VTSLPPDNSFRAWASRWMALASFTGKFVPDAESRIDELVDLWNGPVPGIWERSLETLPPRLRLGRPPYSRGNAAGTRRGEHELEHEILSQISTGLTMFGFSVTDGVNAFPLVRDSGGGRDADVEADLVLLRRSDVASCGWICEVKSRADNAWFAVVENLRQLKLVRESAWVTEFCETRVGQLTSPLTGVVITLEAYYTSDGQKAGCIHTVRCLMSRLAANGLPLVQLATWDRDRAAVELYLDTA
jgi:hypothetical protein